jgi:hypothetical protein
LQPFATITQALANLGTKTRVYVCNGTYSEQVVIGTPVNLYGGLSCAGGASGRAWSYVGQAAEVNSPSPAYALSVANVNGGAVTIEDMSFVSPDATDPGGSSIAAIVTSSTLSLRRVTLNARNGADGADGANGSADPNYTGLAPDGGIQAEPGPPDAGPFVPAGGVGATNPCARFGFSAGGHGGSGCATGPGSPGLGTPGTAAPPAPVVVAGRDGQPRGAMAGTGFVMSDDPGADGVPGDGGLAAPTQAYGILSASGWLPSAGGDGEPGDPGQGGAGATDPLYGMCGAKTTESLGGGGGGAGGCGGSGGQGGGGGGASIALASLTSTIDLTACTLIASAGGTGGAGGAGQDGQAGGAGGEANRLGTRAPGAAGGNGAGGSGGAGGTGGISVDILESGSAVASDMATMQSAIVGNPGVGGTPGRAGLHGGALSLTTGTDGNPGMFGGPGTAGFHLELM